MDQASSSSINNYGPSEKGKNQGPVTYSTDLELGSTRLLPKKILKGPLQLKAENLRAQYMKWKVLLWKIQMPRAILRVPQATKLLLGNSLVNSKIFLIHSVPDGFGNSFYSRPLASNFWHTSKVKQVSSKLYLSR